MPYFALIIMFYHVKIACYHIYIYIFIYLFIYNWKKLKDLSTKLKILKSDLYPRAN